MMASRTLLHAIFAVSAALVLSGAEARTVSALRADDGTGFELSFGDAAPGETNSLFIAYGSFDGGTTLSGWESVQRVNLVSQNGVDGDVIVGPEVMTCFVPNPTALATARYVRFFLFAGETGVPYETRHASMSSPTTMKDLTDNRGAWIDTGIVPTLDTGIRIVVSADGTQPMFGTVNQFYCFDNGNSGVLPYYGFLGWNSPTQTGDIRCNDGLVHEIRLDRNGISVDGKSRGKAPVPTDIPAKGSIALFGRNNDESSFNANRVCKGTIYSAVITEGGRAVRHFAFVRSDGVACLFDLVSGMLFYPHREKGGTYTLTAGAQVATATTQMERTGVSEPVWVSAEFAPEQHRNWKCQIAFPGYTADETQMNFPALVKLAPNQPSGFSYDACRDDGSDLVFADEDGALLSFEVEQWNPNGTSLVWVRVPSLAAGTSIWLYWGDRDGTLAPTAGKGSDVWLDYAGVWHLDEDTGVAADATGHGLDASPGVEGSTRLAAGVVGSARGKAGGFWMLAPNYDDLRVGDTFTVSGFFKQNGTWQGSRGQYIRLFARCAKGKNNGFQVNLSVDPGTFTARGNNSTSDVPANGPTLADWGHLTVAYRGTTFDFYGDGELTQHSAGVLDAAPADNGLPLGIGAFNDGRDLFDGWMDELRIYKGAMTAARVQAEYAVMVSNATFVSCGAAAPCGDGLAIDSVVAEPALPGDRCMISGTVLNNGAPADGATVRIGYGTDSAELQPWPTPATCGADGRFEVLLTGLVADRTYVFQVHAMLGAAEVDSPVRRFTTLGASTFDLTALSVVANVLTCSGEVRLGAGATTVVLLCGDAPDALTEEIAIAEFPQGSTDGSFSAGVDVTGWVGRYCKLVCRNEFAGQSWSDESAEVTRQSDADAVGATYTWKSSVAEGAWTNAANWTVEKGVRGWPHLPQAAAIFPAMDSLAVVDVPKGFVKSLSFSTGASASLAIGEGATLVVSDDPLVTNGTVTVRDTDLRLTGGRLACEAINFTRTAADKPCSLTVSDGGELWLGGSATMTTTGTRAELHVVGTGSVQLGRPDDGYALWKLSDGAKMFLGSERSNVRKSFEGSNALLEVTNGVHAGTIKFQAGARDNLARVSGPTTVVTSMLYMDSVTSHKNNLVLVEKGATYALPQAFRDIRGTSNVVRIVDTTFTCPSFGADPGAYLVSVFGSTANAGPGNGVEFCGTSPKLTVADAWGSGTSSGAPIENSARLVFSVSGAGYSAAPITVGGTATVYGNTVFEVRVAKGTRQFSIPLMTVASTPWAEEGHLKAVVDRLNAVAVLPKNAKLVVSKDGKTLFCKRPSGMLLFVK